MQCAHEGVASPFDLFYEELDHERDLGEVSARHMGTVGKWRSQVMGNCRITP